MKIKFKKTGPKARTPRKIARNLNRKCTTRTFDAVAYAAVLEVMG